MSYESRQALLHVTRCWIAEHYVAGSSEPVAWEDATRAVFGLPTEADADVLKMSDFTPQAYAEAIALFRDVVETGRAGMESEVPDWEICLASWRSVRVEQQDLNPAQRREAVLSTVIDTLQFYVTYHAGGLYEATAAINVATSGDYEILLGGES